ALDDLAETDAELLRLWAWEQLEPAEIAAVLGCSPGTARTRMHRARTRLRVALIGRGVSGPAVEDAAGALPTAADDHQPHQEPHQEPHAATGSEES
ncbi:MAG: sigma-70 family RNA polymerase sigma factor, partial [Candidatus Nanopelagicales bacterium]